MTDCSHDIAPVKQKNYLYKMGSAIKILPHYTYEEYCLWEGKWELIDGIPYAMSPSPIPEHQWVNANVKGEFRNAIKKSGCKNCRVYDFIDIKISEDTVLQPDALIVWKPITKKFLDFPAVLVAEILSPATALKDRNSKFFLYEKMGIRYFLIIDIDKKLIEINILTGNKYHHTTYSNTTTFQFLLEENCNIEVELSNIWE